MLNSHGAATLETEMAVEIMNALNGKQLQRIREWIYDPANQGKGVNVNVAKALLQTLDTMRGACGRYERVLEEFVQKAIAGTESNNGYCNICGQFYNTQLESVSHFDWCSVHKAEQALREKPAVN